jgi:hypothetical protein
MQCSTSNVTRTVLRSVVIAVLVAAAAPRSATAAPLVYDFSGVLLAPSMVPAGTSASDLLPDSIFIILGGFGNPAPSGGPFDNSGPSGTHYTSFTLTPNAGFMFDVLGFSFDEINNGTLGPTGFDVYTSADGFSVPILGGALLPSAVAFSSHAAALGSAPFLDLTSPFTVRISGFGGPNGAQSAWLLDNITLDVNVQPLAVPEPALMSLAAVGLIAGALRRRRHQRGRL